MMSKLFWKSLLVSPALLGSIIASSEAIAQVPVSDTLDQINHYSNDGQGNLNQVTNVNQLRDVSPGDWAFEALRNLVERYGCIAGYPSGVYLGNRAMTRYEFAAGLNACLGQIERLIASSTADFITRDDLATLEQLIQQFEGELATLGTRVDDLEGRVAFLEENQFSTTTKLKGEAIFALTDTFGGDDNNNTIFGDRVRLDLVTSFSGEDELHTRLAAGNLAAFDLDNGTLVDPESTQTFNLAPDSTNNVQLDWLAYYFPFSLGGDTEFEGYLAAAGGIHSDYVTTLNPYFEDYDGGNGALSTFATESPIYRIGGGAGGAISFKLGWLDGVLGPTTLTAGYLAGDAANPGNDGGIINGDYAALGQLNFNIGDRIGVGLTYVHGYHSANAAIFSAGAGTTGIVGTDVANLGSGFNTSNTPNVTNTYGGELAFRLTENVSISGFATYTDVIALEAGDDEIWSYGAGIAFADIGKEGNVLGFFGGAQPYLGGGEDLAVPNGDLEIPYHIEGFYKYQVNDNISITPGVIYLMNPGQDSGNDDVFIGTLRTTFTF